MSYTIHFSEVGRDRRSWSVTTASVSEVAIVAEVRKSGALKSSDLDVKMDDEDQSGSIFVGGWRRVGGFRWEAAK